MTNKKKSRIKIVILLFIIFISIGFICFNYSDFKIKTLPFVDQTKSFSVVILPDTQFYSAKYPEILCRQVEWIVENKDKYNIVFVSQIGDIVNDGAIEIRQWENASRCFGKLDGIMPYSVIPGNHDTNVPSDKSSGFSAYNKYFPVSRFSTYSWYGGNYKNNQNNYQLINTGDLSMLFINLEIEPDDKVLDWAKNIIEQNKDRYTILTTHKYLPVNSSKRDNSLDYSKDGNTGEKIWNKLIFNNCSIKQVWSGHFHGENRIISKNYCGDDVQQILNDYQERENGGNGWLRLNVFTPGKDLVQAYTYSPYLDKTEYDFDSMFEW